MLQAAKSGSSFSSDPGHTRAASGGTTDYSRSALEASAAQKDSFFARRMEVSSTCPQTLAGCTSMLQPW